MKASHALIKHLAQLLAQSGYSHNKRADKGVSVFSRRLSSVAFMPAGDG